MEIDVTHMVEDSDEMPMLSGSKMDLGNDAGQITWNNSVAYGKQHPLLTTDDMRDAARTHFREYGSWSKEEIEAWSEDDLQGIMCQDVAASIREMKSAGTYKDYVVSVADGTYSGRLFTGDIEYESGCGRWYFYLGI